MRVCFALLAFLFGLEVRDGEVAGQATLSSDKLYNSEKRSAALGWLLTDYSGCASRNMSKQVGAIRRGADYLLVTPFKVRVICS